MYSSGSMLIYIFRHADKESDFSDDPSLSEKGFEQANQLAASLASKELPTPNRIWVSEKKRTSQTAAIASQRFAIPIEQQKDLDERKHSEDRAQFKKRIQNALNRAEDSALNLFLISHMDWVAEAMTLINTSDSFSNQQHYDSFGAAWKTCEFVGFEVRDGEWHLIQTGRVAANKLEVKK